jgi:zinc protease
MLALLLFLGLSAQAQTFPVEKHTLKNGMTVLINEDHSIPNVALYTFYKIGSRNERPGTTGLSHFFEHMMFNGAKKYGPGEFDRVMEANGGSNNAYTNNDVTVYQDWFPVSALRLIFDLEADRIRDLSFDPKMVNSERGVVASERRTSVENNNFGALYEQLGAAAFIAHPYHWPVIGWMSDIESWTIEDLKAHWAMGYAPNNAVMVVSGAVDPKQFMALAQEYIEPIPRRDPPPPVRTKEPEQDGERRVKLEKFAQLPILMAAYHVPDTAHPDFYPLQILDAILSTGQSSRLYRRLVDKDQLAIDVSTGIDFAFDPTLFTVTARPRENVAPEALEKALYEELARVQNELVSDQEIEKAKNMLLVQFYQQMKTINGRANAIGTYEVFFGDYHKLFQAAELYAKVTREDVQRVAKQYLKPTNRTVATLVPVKPPEQAQPAKGGVQ